MNEGLVAATAQDNDLQSYYPSIGLKQAGRGWYQEMSRVLIKELGFNHSAANHSVFFRRTEEEHTIITVATDDMALTSKRAVDTEKYPKVLGHY